MDIVVAIAQFEIKRDVSKWRQLRRKTDSHGVICACEECKEKRAIARDRRIPDEGPVLENRIFRRNGV